jgi:hypothetical protein
MIVILILRLIITADCQNLTLANKKQLRAYLDYRLPTGRRFLFCVKNSTRHE